MPSPNSSPYRDASATSRGFISINDQEFSGIKSFLSPLKMAVYTEAELPTGALMGTFVYNSTVNRMMVHTGAQWLQVVLANAVGDTASLEEHLIDATAAHPGTAIEWTSGSFGWADTSDFDPPDVENAIVSIVEELSSNAGSQKIGASSSGGLTANTVHGQLVQLDNTKVRTDTLAAATGTTQIGGAAKSDTYFSLSAGNLKAQLEQLLTHINAARPDLVAPTLLASANGSVYSNVHYSKDNCGYGHVLGNMENDTGAGISAPFLFGTLPAGVRPTKAVWLRAPVLDFSGTPNGTQVNLFINTDGTIRISGTGTIGQACYVVMDFPAYKCA